MHLQVAMHSPGDSEPSGSSTHWPTVAVALQLYTTGVGTGVGAGVCRLDGSRLDGSRGWGRRDGSRHRSRSRGRARRRSLHCTWLRQQPVHYTHTHHNGQSAPLRPRMHHARRGSTPSSHGLTAALLTQWQPLASLHAHAHTPPRSECTLASPNHRARRGSTPSPHGPPTSLATHTPGCHFVREAHPRPVLLQLYFCRRKRIRSCTSAERNTSR